MWGIKSEIWASLMATAAFCWQKQNWDFTSTGYLPAILFDQPVSDVHFTSILYQLSQNLCEICNKHEWGVKEEEEAFF